VHDRLYARAVAFTSGGKRLVFVSVDLSGFASWPVYHFQKQIYERYGLKPDELFLCGTHTHSAPLLFGSRTYPHPNNFAYTEALPAKLVEVVGKALKAAAPVRLAIGKGHSDVAVNRRLPEGGRIEMARNPDGPVDRTVSVLKIARRDGSPVAAMFEYGCHSRSLRSANRLVSGDIFGIAEQHAEKIVGAVAPAFAGASGDVDPWHVVQSFDGGETVAMGTALGEEVARACNKATEVPSGAIRTFSERLTVPGKHGAKQIQITAAALGGIAWIGLDSETLVEVGRQIKAASPFPHTFLFTHCNGGSGYLPPRHRFPEGGYEIEISGFAPEAADLLTGRVKGLLQSLR
jgi:hypothetical protein